MFESNRNCNSRCQCCICISTAYFVCLYYQPINLSINQATHQSLFQFLSLFGFVLTRFNYICLSSTWFDYYPRIPFVIFSGLFLNANDIPNYFIWIYYISFVRYGFEAVMINEVHIHSSSFLHFFTQSPVLLSSSTMAILQLNRFIFFR